MTMTHDSGTDKSSTLPEVRMSSAPSRETAWERAVSVLLLTLCLSACQSAPTAPTRTDANDARRAEIVNAFNDAWAAADEAHRAEFANVFNDAWAAAARRAEIANAFNDTFTGWPVNDAVRAKIAQSGGGGAGFQINRFRVK